ncbi:hypothetical protein [Streptomyces sp. NBC_00063]|uniref:hypothetical protein n=1 Tax=Streptomyces sp. NBC_00063 TaxID=2975638 RepID=UPI003D74524A
MLLRPARSGPNASGESSTDDGATWQTVGTVPLTGALSALDVGLFRSAANGGSGARGPAGFAGWELTTP